MKTIIQENNTIREPIPKDVIFIPARGVFFLWLLAALGLVILLTGIAQEANGLVAWGVLITIPSIATVRVYTNQVDVYNEKFLQAGRFEYREHVEEQAATRLLPEKSNGGIPNLPDGLLTATEFASLQTYISKGNTTISGRPLANAGVLKSKDDSRLAELKEWLSVTELADVGHSGAMEINQEGVRVLS